MIITISCVSVQCTKTNVQQIVHNILYIRLRVVVRIVPATLIFDFALLFNLVVGQRGLSQKQCMESSSKPNLPTLEDSIYQSPIPRIGCFLVQKQVFVRYEWQITKLVFEQLFDSVFCSQKQSQKAHVHMLAACLGELRQCTYLSCPRN